MTSDMKANHCMDCKCLSWKPIIAGALVALGLTFLLNLFSVAISLTAYTTNSEGVETLALGGLIGTSIAVVASMFAAGWISGYLGRNYCAQRHLGAIYGFLTWCLALILAMFFMGHAQEYVAYYGHSISGAAHTLKIATGTTAASVSTKSASETLVISTYVIFVLFFLGAFASSLGGHCGMRHKCKEMNK
jgi:hypothetical protein